MNREYRTAYVYVRDIFAGILKEEDFGYSFEYNSDYLKDEKNSAVSLTMPLREEAYRSGVLFPFFDGLIPEGWLLRTVISNWKLDGDDRFGLLLVACRDCIGNVSIQEAEE